MFRDHFLAWRNVLDDYKIGPMIFYVFFSQNSPKVSLNLCPFLWGLQCLKQKKTMIKKFMSLLSPFFPTDPCAQPPPRRSNFLIGIFLSEQLMGFSLSAFFKKIIWCICIYIMVLLLRARKSYLNLLLSLAFLMQRSSPSS